MIKAQDMQLTLFDDIFDQPSIEERMIEKALLRGSGSTLRAAVEINRHAYGFEIKKDMYRLAHEKMLSVIPTSLIL